MKFSSFVMLSSREEKLSSWVATELSLVVEAVELTAVVVATELPLVLAVAELTAVVVAVIQVIAVVVVVT
jgi:hypothetical protein